MVGAALIRAGIYFHLWIACQLGYGDSDRRFVVYIIASWLPIVAEDESVCCIETLELGSLIC